MESWYPVQMGSNAVGKVRLVRQGLYYSIRCRCRIGGDVMYRLTVCCRDKRIDLGVVVPVDGGFGLDTKIPVKRLGEGTVSFLLTPKYTPQEETLIPVYPEEPFRYISRIKEAYLVKRGNQTCICIK